MKVKLTAGFVSSAAAPSSDKDRIIYWDEKRPGFGLMITSKAKRSYVFQYRNSKGESRRASLDGSTKLADAHKWADILQGDLARGADPVEKKKTERAEQSTRSKFKVIAEQYVKREGSKIRSMNQRTAILKRLVYPVIGEKDINRLKRSDIVSLLDKIEDERGAGMADSTLMVVRRVCNWHASRDDEFRSPIVRGMSRTDPAKRSRERTLTDDELRAVWLTAVEIGAGRLDATPAVQVFARLVQFILLTAVRRNEGARIVRQELTGADWLMPAARVKGKREFLIPLSKAALGVLESLPVIGDEHSGPIFTTDGERPISGYSQAKDPFDKLCGVTDWTIHDLRRTARSLMSRAGVQADHAERAIGHAIRGIRGTYDRHEFYNEKKQAFEALAAQIDRIVSPPDNNVVEFRTGVSATA
jgi:integrase